MTRNTEFNGIQSFDKIERRWQRILYRFAMLAKEFTREEIHKLFDDEARKDWIERARTARNDLRKLHYGTLSLLAREKAKANDKKADGGSVSGI